MKVFEFNNEDRKAWIVANTKTQAIKYYEHLTNCSDVTAIELSDDDAKRRQVVDANQFYENKEDGDLFHDGYLIIGNMYDLALCATRPEIIANNYE